MKYIKKISCLFTALILLCGCSQNAENNSSININNESVKDDSMILENVSEDNVYTPVYKKCKLTEDAPMESLSNTLYKLTSEKKLTVAYFGGSVTEGVGATTSENSWTHKTTEWLKETYKQAEISPVYAALGGTGSGYGLTRAKRDLLSYNPDLVFIEFALNDCYLNCSAEESGFFLENLIREIYSQSKYTDIVVVFITDKGLNGQDNDTISLQRNIATHYGINTVNVGAELVKEITANGKTWEDFILDWVHPLDIGHESYSNTIKESLKNLLRSGEGYSKKKLPKKYMQNVSDSVNTIYVENMDKSVCEGFVLRNHGVFGESLQHLTSTSQNATIELKFSGKGVLIDAQQGKTCCGQVTAVVDGKYKRNFTLKLDSGERQTKTLFLGLENTEHTLKITNVSGGNLTIASITELK